METKKATVTKVTQNTGSYNGKYGTMYKHLIEFNNGDKGEYYTKTDQCAKFMTGQEVAYTIETKVNGQYTNTIIRPVMEQQQVSGFMKKYASGSDESFSASYAKDIWVAKIQAKEPFDVESFIKVADRLYDWMKSKKQSA